MDGFASALSLNPLVFLSVLRFLVVKKPPPLTSFASGPSVHHLRDKRNTRFLIHHRHRIMQAAKDDPDMLLRIGNTQVDHQVGAHGMPSLVENAPILQADDQRGINRHCCRQAGDININGFAGAPVERGRNPDVPQIFIGILGQVIQFLNTGSEAEQREQGQCEQYFLHGYPSNIS